MRKKLKQKLFLLYSMVVFVFVFLSSFRWENGTDWQSYYDYFFNQGDYMEIGYTVFNSITSYTGNYTIHLFLLAVICIIPLGRLILSYSPFPLFSLFIWFACNLGTIFPVRQNISIALFAISIQYLINRSPVKYLVCVLLACLFHISAIIVLPLYWIWNVKLSRNKICVLIIGFTLFSVLSSKFLSQAFEFIDSDFVQMKLASYFGSSDNTFGSAYSADQILYRGIINRLFLLFMLFFFLDRLRLKNSVLNGFFNLYVYSYLLFVVFTPISVAFGRFCTYTDIMQIILIPYLFSVKMQKNTKLMVLVFIMAYFYIRFRGVVANYYDSYVPFHFVFFT